MFVRLRGWVILVGGLLAFLLWHQPVCVWTHRVWIWLLFFT
jgi:hypothetical protein